MSDPFSDFFAGAAAGGVTVAFGTATAAVHDIGDGVAAGTHVVGDLARGTEDVKTDAQAALRVDEALVAPVDHVIRAVIDGPSAADPPPADAPAGGDSGAPSASAGAGDDFDFGAGISTGAGAGAGPVDGPHGTTDFGASTGFGEIADFLT